MDGRSESRKHIYAELSSRDTEAIVYSENERLLPPVYCSITMPSSTSVVWCSSAIAAQCNLQRIVLYTANKCASRQEAHRADSIQQTSVTADRRPIEIKTSKHVSS
jgi:hypothetical protein